MEVKQRSDKGAFGSVPSLIFRLIGLAVINGFGLWLIYQMYSDGVYPFAAILAIVTILINVIFLYEPLYPLRWMAPGLALMTLMALYPVIFTVYTAFTNYSDGHILSKQQAIERLSQDTFLREGGRTFEWVGYRSEEGEYLLWLTNEEGQNFVARPDEPLVPAAEAEVGALDDEGIPATVDGYTRLETREVVPIIEQLGQMRFGEPPTTLQIRSLREVAGLDQRYVYDAEQDAVIDQQSGTAYFANPDTGFFTSDEGNVLIPGYQVEIGVDNFRRLFTSRALSGPLVRIFIWTFVFAGLTVLTTFSLGLLVALVFNTRDLVGRKLIRSLLIIPYTIPSVISVLLWRGLMNERFGLINTTLTDLVGWAPPWLSDPTWVKVAIILINLWLGYPYMMLICSGALQAIPEDIYEAATMDGASAWQRFWNITLPLLLVSVGPILISSFTFNFNNFNVIYLFNQGGPPIAGTPTPAGHSDILISYTYRLAFAGGRGADYAFAAAITVIIFIILTVVTLFNFRFTRVWEEVSESV
jgi:ABC-type sugar transport system permease subunit